MALYGKLQYWEDRYLHSGDTCTFEWYQTYGDLSHLLGAKILKTPFDGVTRLQDLSPDDLDELPGTNTPAFPSRELCRVLILGCGNSSFGQDMINDGWTGDIVNVDYSSVVIDQMIKKHDTIDEGEEKQATMRYVCADITHGLPFDDGSFDLIICKGTFDAILCSNGSVSSIKRLVAECDRVLAHGHGCLIVVTHGNPDNRVVFLEHENDPTYYWKGICIATVPKRNKDTSPNDYVYICRKKSTDVEDLTEQDETSGIQKGVGEENIEVTGDQHKDKLKTAGHSNNRSKLKNKN